MYAVQENLRFMLLEVNKQLERTLHLLAHPKESTIQRVEERDDYIDNLKGMIEDRCFSQIHGEEALSQRQSDQLRASHTVAINLERIADYAVNIVRQMRYLSDESFLQRYDYRPFFEVIFEALQKIEVALLKKNMSYALQICRSEWQLDEQYKEQFDDILYELEQGERTGDLITVLFIFRYLERIGDALLNIGEAILFSIVGDKFKLRQYNAIRDALDEAGVEMPLSSVEFESIWGTRSGCRISKLQPDRETGPTQGVIFKDGNRQKLLAEKASFEFWEELMPGLPPKVVAFQEEGSSVSLLIEYLNGQTLQEILLSADEAIARKALFRLFETVNVVWNKTKKEKSADVSFVGQLRSRLADVYRVHPHFHFPERQINDLVIPSLESLLGQVQHLYQGLTSPLSVQIHGDFNVNNIVYSAEEDGIHYIDLHRSQQTDYVQDLSVFLVSNFRLPVFERPVRRRIGLALQQGLDFGRRFARRHDDRFFELRLIVGTARSLITSTRFEFNKSFARDMFLRGIYLLQHIASRHDIAWEAFHFPEAILQL